MNGPLAPGRAPIRLSDRLEWVEGIGKPLILSSYLGHLTLLSPSGPRSLGRAPHGEQLFAPIAGGWVRLTGDRLSRHELTRRGRRSWLTVIRHPAGRRRVGTQGGALDVRSDSETGLAVSVTDGAISVVAFDPNSGEVGSEVHLHDQIGRAHV